MTLVVRGVATSALSKEAPLRAPLLIVQTLQLVSEQQLSLC